MAAEHENLSPARDGDRSINGRRKSPRSEHRTEHTGLGFTWCGEGDEAAQAEQRNRSWNEVPLRSRRESDRLPNLARPLNDIMEVMGGKDAPAPPPVAPSTPLRSIPGFRNLWVGQFLSDLGSNVMLLAYPLLILDLTHSAVIAGAVGTVRVAVSFAFRLPAGALSDRLDRRITMIVCDSIRALVMVMLGILVLLRDANWEIVLVALIIDSAGGVIFDPAATAALPGIVPSEQLESAWASTEARTYAANLGGPALGGILFGLGRAVPFLSDAVSYAVSVGTVSRIRGHFRPQREGEPHSLWKETLDGVRVVWHDALSRAVLIQAPLINFAFAGVIFTITIALRRGGYSATVIGLVQAGIAIGGLLGAIVAPRLQGRMSLSRLVVTLTTSAAALLFLGAIATPSPLVALPVAMTFFLAPTANAALFAAMLRGVPDHLRGRVVNTVITVATALSALAPITAGLIVQHFSGRWAMFSFAVSMVVSAIMALSLRGLRAAEAEALTGIAPSPDEPPAEIL